MPGWGVHVDVLTRLDSLGLPGALSVKVTVLYSCCIVKGNFIYCPCYTIYLFICIQRITTTDLSLCDATVNECFYIICIWKSGSESSTEREQKQASPNRLISVEKPINSKARKFALRKKKKKKPQIHHGYDPRSFPKSLAFYSKPNCI